MLAALKYVHVLLYETQCASVDAQRRVCGAAGYFSPSDRRSGSGRALRPLGPDKDAVCGALPGACVALLGCQRRGGEWGQIFIGMLPEFNTGISLCYPCC